MSLRYCIPCVPVPSEARQQRRRRLGRQQLRPARCVVAWLEYT
jgi:hypothetical protein